MDSFDLTIFLLIMLPISQKFGVLTDVAVVFTVTLWMRLVGAVCSGWLGDRVGRRIPLMISVLMLIGCVIGGASSCLALFLGPETRGKEMVPDLVLA